MSAQQRRTEWIVATLRSQPLLEKLDEAVTRQLVEHGSVQRYEAGDEILREGAPPDHVFFLLNGAARVFHRDADGSELLLKLFRGPAMFGEIEVLAGVPYGEYVAAIETCQALLMKRAAFLELVKRRPAFAVDVLTDVSTRFCVAVQNLKAVAFHDVRARLADLFLDYAALDGEETPDGVHIQTRLTQDGMARDLAVSRKAINATLKTFKEEGIVTKLEGRYLVRDLEALRTSSTGSLARAYSTKR